MPAHKRKPYYNGSITMQELLTAVCEYYGDPVDDRKSEDLDHVSVHDVADRFNITVMKARKLLITGGLYSTAISRRVQELHAQGMTVAQITEETGLKRASINSYLPYAHIIYNLPDISIKAERQKQYRVRKRNSVRTDVEREEKLWQELIYLQGCLFTTSKGLDFTYKIHGGEMFVGRKEKSITKATVMKAYGKVVELEGEVKGPKVLGTFGASYLYPIFIKMGLIWIVACSIFFILFGMLCIKKAEPHSYGSKYTISVGFPIIGIHVVLLNPVLTTSLPSYIPRVHFGHQP